MTTLAPIALALLALAADGPPAPTPRPADVVAALESAVVDAVARAEASVVAITRVRNPNPDDTTAVRGRNPLPAAPELTANPFGLARLSSPDFLAMPGDYGAGVVVGDRGEILTSYHLLRGSAQIRVRAVDRVEFDAEILAADPRSDLAIIAPREVPGTAPPRLKALTLGDASTLRRGSFVVALGNPYNAARDGRASASWGIVANTGRRLEPPEVRDATPQLRHQPTLLQLDAKLNQGMSGGAVVNLRGELVGITTTGGNPAGLDGQAGYAVPMDALGRRIVEALRRGREVEYGMLGIGLDQNGTNRVQSIRLGSPAEAAELVVNDEIIGVGDRAVSDREDLSLAISSVGVGEPVKLRVRRLGSELELAVSMAKFPADRAAIATAKAESWRGLRVDFTSVMQPPTPDAEPSEAVSRGGVSVVEVDPGSVAEKAGLARNQVIAAVDGQPVRTPAEFARAVARGGSVTLTVRQGREPDRRVVLK